MDLSVGGIIDLVFNGILSIIKLLGVSSGLGSALAGLFTQMAEKTEWLINLIIGFFEA
ncbi:MAG: hypothetical protein LBR73_03395 [Oscillospiraceae bacterium]|jgi:hypothetical protein|nr:hypothetical protein [Oscillospiraceae bacterium]